MQGRAGLQNNKLTRSSDSIRSRHLSSTLAVPSASTSLGSSQEIEAPNQNKKDDETNNGIDPKRKGEEEEEDEDEEYYESSDYESDEDDINNIRSNIRSTAPNKKIVNDNTNNKNRNNSNNSPYATIPTSNLDLDNRNNNNNNNNSNRFLYSHNDINVLLPPRSSTQVLLYNLHRDFQIIWRYVTANIIVNYMFRILEA